MFEVLDVLFWELEPSSVAWTALMDSYFLELNLMQFLIQEIRKFSTCKIFHLRYQIPGSGTGSGSALT
jgi:hypothetical protein